MRAAPTRLKMFASQAPHFAPGAAPKPARRARGTRFPRRRRKTVLKRPLWGCVYTDNGKRVSEIMIRAIFKQSEQSFSWKFVSQERVTGARQLGNRSEKRGLLSQRPGHALGGRVPGCSQPPLLKAGIWEPGGTAPSRPGRL